MSEIIRNNRRNDAGQFTPEHRQPVTGSELATPRRVSKRRPRDPEPEEISSDAESFGKLAANRNAAKVPELSLSVTEVREANGGIDTTEAVTVEQAAKDLAAARADIAKFADGVNFDGWPMRSIRSALEAIEGDKAKAKHFGFELEDGAKPEAKQD